RLTTVPLSLAAFDRPVSDALRDSLVESDNRLICIAGGVQILFKSYSQLDDHLKVLELIDRGDDPSQRVDVGRPFFIVDFEYSWYGEVPAFDVFFVISSTAIYVQLRGEM